MSDNTPAGGVTLPELPEPDFQATERNLGHNAYTADQMREYARAALAGEWRDIASAPASEPIEQAWFLAYCPDDGWAPLGHIHIACRYPNDPPGFVHVQGSPQKRRATHFMAPAAPLPKEPGQ